jgi:hypothetical protein
MFTAVHEWSRPAGAAALASPPHDLCPAAPGASFTHLYNRLLVARPDAGARAQARAFLHECLAGLQDSACELPDAPQDLQAWMECSAQLVTAKYTAYLEDRKAGAPRRYFSNRAQALYFLRAVAPIKLVDGAWLYGLVEHWRNPRLGHLVRTYVEELGEGLPDKNHVLLYRKLLAQHGLDSAAPLDDAFHEQGLVQLALGWSAHEFLPEVIGFNLGYEQLPLHLLITAHELDELGIDPYYFTLHVTVDNADSGHARRACQAVMDMLPQLGDADVFWQRVRNGSQLAGLGLGTTDVIQGFDIEAEAQRIFAGKSQAGHGAHSDYCRVAGRSVNDWLAQPEQVPAFLAALQQAGWIVRGAPVERSRFWSLLQGERAQMFGVFTDYELQVIHDWIRGEASKDGRPFTSVGSPPKRQPSFRATERLATLRGTTATAVVGGDVLDPDLEALDEALKSADPTARAGLLAEAMSPALHWTSAGLHATRLFHGAVHGGARCA